VEQVDESERYTEVGEMLETQEYLKLVRRRGEKGLELSRIYRNMRRRELFLLAYSNLYANTGAMTPGIDPEDTVDGMSLERIDNIIETLANGEYTWTPVRRTYIEKKSSSKMRPLGIPGWNDKLVQEVMKFILEAYFEPQFRDCSHGFRPNKGCHTALRDVWYIGTGTRWFIE
jgi:retron-type reverse transcriptase